MNALGTFLHGFRSWRIFSFVVDVLADRARRRKASRMKKVDAKLAEHFDDIDAKVRKSGGGTCGGGGGPTAFAVVLLCAAIGAGCGALTPAWVDDIIITVHDAKDAVEGTEPDEPAPDLPPVVEPEPEPEPEPPEDEDETTWKDFPSVPVVLDYERDWTLVCNGKFAKPGWKDRIFRTGAVRDGIDAFYFRPNKGIYFRLYEDRISFTECLVGDGYAITGEHATEDHYAVTLPWVRKIRGDGKRHTMELRYRYDRKRFKVLVDGALVLDFRFKIHSRPSTRTALYLIGFDGTVEQVDRSTAIEDEHERTMASREWY